MREDWFTSFAKSFKFNLIIICGKTTSVIYVYIQTLK